VYAAVTSAVGGKHLPESLSGPCRCLRFHELNTHKVTKKVQAKEMVLDDMGKPQSEETLVQLQRGLEIKLKLLRSEQPGRGQKLNRHWHRP
jgi:hypothetical protein